MAVKQNTGLPDGGKARRVYLLLRDEILNGTFQAKSLLPGEQKLAEIHSVSRITIRRALEALEADGLIERRAGSGTTVRAFDDAGGQVTADFATLMPQLVEMGQSTTARLLSFSYGPASQIVSSAMALPEGARVQTAIRVRLIDGKAFSHLTTHVPEEIAASYTESDLATTPLFRLLERSGVQVADAHQSVSATLAAPDVAEALGVEIGSALLSIRRVVHDTNGRGVEYLSALYRPDLFRLEMTLDRVGSEDSRRWEPVIDPGATQEAAE
ncbi:Transcriptional regulator [Hoeflea phototrophica DFL-43]|uniref:Transcriptional regulator n=1 Tax=Hoeflea phototrophica (strain DSM 17068 / NCIMB 14078 / DFL-43) TaxID=411684 RepID=A9D945_HOEPD|nr:GntR family transcriptional regulator [Hoeflea phototrophica]EDQ32849.1 Transcriptional regulator [Hoeflea phototrophica DFL-43]